ncbi:MAG: hypothetical protein ACRD94_04890 [Nitrosopumilaceae archaeon]
MNPKVEIHSLSIAKSKSEQTVFNKYDIEAALEEVGSTDTETKVKYTFILLSNPKHTRISVEGSSSIAGGQSEIAHYLSQDENNIPRIASTIYQELFPLFYVISKSMQIPCPAFKLSHISAPSQSEVSTQSAQVADTLSQQSAENKASVEPPAYSEQTTDLEKTQEQQESVVEEPNVRPA